MPVIRAEVRWADNTATLKKNIAEGIDVIDAMKRSVDRTVESLGGGGLFSAANKAAAALAQIGDVSKLTASEQERMNTTMERAIEKAEAMGRTVPTAWREIAEATKGAGDASKDWGEKIAEAIENPMQALKNMASGLSESMIEEFGMVGIAVTGVTAVIGAAVVAEFELAEKAAAAGGKVNDMSEKTGIAVPAMDRLGMAAQVAGSSIDQVSNAMFMMERNMGQSPEKVDQGFKRIGLSLREIEELQPEERFFAIAAAMKATEDPVQRNAAVMEIFGRAGRDLIPTLMKIAEAMELTKDIDRFSKEKSVAAEQFEMQTRLIRLEFERFAISLGNDVIPDFLRLMQLYQEFKSMMGGVGLGSAILAGLNLDVTRGLKQQLEEALKPLNLPQPSGRLPGKMALPEKAAIEDATKAWKEMDQAQGTAHRNAQSGSKKTADDAQRLREKVNHIEQGYFGISNAVKDLGVKYEPVSKEMMKSSDALIKKLQDIEHGVATGPTKAMEELGTKVKPAMTDLHRNGLEPLIRDFEALGQVGGGALGEIFHGVGAVMSLMQQMHDGSMPNMKQGLTELKDTWQSLSNMQKATVGVMAGLDIASGLVDPKSKAGSAVSGAKTGATIGANPALMAATGGASVLIGAAAGALVGWLKVSQAEKDARTEFEKFQAQYGTLPNTINAVGDAYAETGRTRAEAEHDMKMALDATHHSAADVQLALKKINSVLDEQKVKAKAVADQIGVVGNALKGVASGLPDRLKPMIDQLMKMPGLSAEAKKSLDTLMQGSKPDFAQLETMAKDYGLTLKDLGPKFQQAHLDKDALKILNDFEQLNDSGVDYGTLISHFAPAFNDIVKQSQIMGTSVPANMKPMLEAMAESGSLLDADGKKMKDTASIKFGEPIKTATDNLIDALNHLGDILSGKLVTDAQTGANGIKAALAGIPDKTVHVHTKFDDATEGTAPGPSPMVEHQGGMVFHQGGVVLPFIPRAHSGLMLGHEQHMRMAGDERLILAQTGEAVLNRRATSALGATAIQALNASGRSAPSSAASSGSGGARTNQAGSRGPTHLHIHVGSKEVADVVLDEIIAGGTTMGKFRKVVRQAS